jgi:hypothetical protein
MQQNCQRRFSKAGQSSRAETIGHYLVASTLGMLFFYSLLVRGKKKYDA